MLNWSYREKLVWCDVITVIPQNNTATVLATDNGDCIIGHSFIRRLRDFTNTNISFDNFILDRNLFKVDFRPKDCRYLFFDMGSVRNSWNFKIPPLCV